MAAAGLRARVLGGKHLRPKPVGVESGFLLGELLDTGYYCYGCRLDWLFLGDGAECYGVSWYVRI